MLGHGNATSLQNPEGVRNGDHSESTAKKLVKEENWKLKDEKALLMRIQGYSNKSIADSLGVNECRVSEILNSPPAKKALHRLRERLREQAFTRLEDKLLGLGEEAIENIRETVEFDASEFSPGSKTKKHQDDVSFKVLETLGYGKGSAERDADRSTKLPKEAGERLARALELAKEADEVEMSPGEDGTFRAEKAS